MKSVPLLKRLTHGDIPAEHLAQVQEKALATFVRKVESGQYLLEAVPCLCGATESAVLATRDRYALHVNTLMCRECGIVWQSPRLTTESLNEFYAHDYRSIYVGEARASDEFFTDQVARGEAAYQFIAPSITSKSNMTVFDVGCGAGGTMVPFKSNGWNAFGCDLGGEYLQYASTKGLEVHVGDIHVLEKYGAPDLVLLCHVLEHLPDPVKSLSEIHDTLAQDGYLYIELPGIFNIHKSYHDILLYLQNAHLYYFTLKTLTSLLAMAGFELVKGNEEIGALFRKAPQPFTVQTNDQPRRIRRYLIYAEIYRRLGLRHIGALKRLALHLRFRIMQIIRSFLGNEIANSIKKFFQRGA